MIFLDRDGTINVDHGYVAHRDRWEFVPGALDALKRLQIAGFALAVATNQSAVGARRCTSEDVLALHQFMVEQLAEHGVTLQAVAFCPHSSNISCNCRKPKTGLARAIEAHLQSEIDYGRSWTIGDKVSDIEFGRQLGTRTVLLRSRYWQEDDLLLMPDGICASILPAAQFVLSQCGFDDLARPGSHSLM
jgi:D-glycero-D-manno-heptose 1,7-bisphosphate phosphatase